jgi:hypothetical protein
MATDDEKRSNDLGAFLLLAPKSSTKHFLLYKKIFLFQSFQKLTRQFE